MNACLFSEYVDKLLEETQRRRENYTSYRKAKSVPRERRIPPAIASKFPKPDKLVLVGDYRCRYNVDTSIRYDVNCKFIKMFFYIFHIQQLLFNHLNITITVKEASTSIS